MIQEKRGMLTRQQLPLVGGRKTIAEAVEIQKNRAVEIDTDSPIHEIVAEIDRIIAEKTLSGKISLFRQDGRLVAIVQPEDGPLKILAVPADFFPVCISPFI